MCSSFTVLQTSARMLPSIPYEMGKPLDSFEQEVTMLIIIFRMILAMMRPECG